MPLDACQIFLGTLTRFHASLDLILDMGGFYHTRGWGQNDHHERTCFFDGIFRIPISSKIILHD
jgi:hypothetical protein